MTSKEALHSLIDELNDGEAGRWFEQITNSRRDAGSKPTLRQVISMTGDRQAEFFAKYPAEIETNELTDWDATDAAELTATSG